MMVNKWWLNSMFNDDQNYQQQNVNSTIVFSVNSLCSWLLSYILVVQAPHALLRQEITYAHA